MTKWNLIVDVASCTNCNNCTLAVQDEYVGNDWPGYAAEMPKHGHHWIDIKRMERGAYPMLDVAYVPTMCQHCDDPPCMKVAKNDAVQKRDDGIVIIRPERAKGQRELVDACPFGAVWWNEEKEIPQHWTFDAHLIDAGWDQPRCAQICATSVFEAVKATDEEMDARIRRENLRPLRSDIDVRPRVWYKNLHLYDSVFIGGAVSSRTGGVEDCLEGADVTLRRDGKLLGRASTDAFGQFKFDGLDPNLGPCSVEIASGAGQTEVVDVNISDKSLFLGDIVLAS